MPAFHEVRFPDTISRGSSGGPERRTDIVEMRSGAEERNAVWKNSRRRYNAGIGLRDIDDVYKVQEFFEARKGRLHGFRWKDWSDYRETTPNVTGSIAFGPTGGFTIKGTQLLLPLNQNASVVGAIQFQLRKKYSSGGVDYLREIRKPVAGSVNVWAVTNVGPNGSGGSYVSPNALTAYAEGVNYTVDYTTGILTFVNAPIPSVVTPMPVLRAAFEFDVPVRFESDNLSVNVELFNVAGVNDISILEIKV